MIQNISIIPKSFLVLPPCQCPTLPTPVQRQPLFCFLSHGFVLPSLDRHVNRIIEYGFLGLASFAQRGGFTIHHPVTRFIIQPAVPALLSSIHWMDIPRLVYPFSWFMTFGCFHVRALMSELSYVSLFCGHLSSFCLSKCLNGIAES